MVLLLGYISIGHEEFPVYSTGDGMYIEVNGQMQKIYADKSLIHKERMTK